MLDSHHRRHPASRLPRLPYHSTQHTSPTLAIPPPQNVLVSSRGGGPITPESLVAKLTDMGNGCELGGCKTALGGRKGLTAPEAGMQTGRPGSVHWVATESDVGQSWAQPIVPRLEARRQLFYYRHRYRAHTHSFTPFALI